MRKLLSSTAGATFHEEHPTMTMCVRKDLVEVIYKLERGTFMILNMVRMDDHEVILFANWDTYFDRIQNPQVQMPRVKQNCPKLYEAMFNGTPEGIKQVIMGKKDNSQVQGFAISLPLSYKDFPFLCLTPEVVEAARKLIKKNLEIYHELFDNPPFPAWKDGLSILWN